MPTHYEKTRDETIIYENQIYEKVLQIFVKLLFENPDINYKIAISDGCPYCITNNSQCEPKYFVYIEHGTLMCLYQLL